MLKKTLSIDQYFYKCILADKADKAIEILKDADFQVQTFTKDWKFMPIKGARLTDEIFDEKMR